MSQVMKKKSHEIALGETFFLVGQSTPPSIMALLNQLIALASLICDLCCLKYVEHILNSMKIRQCALEYLND